MPYSYLLERPKLFTEEHQRNFLRLRDRLRRLLEDAGAVRLHEASVGVSFGESWLVLAAFDRLVELGELREIPTQGAAQHRIFVSAS